MGSTMEIVVVTFMLYVCVAGAPPPEKCTQAWEKVGCFHDTFKTDADRVFPNELVNHRDKNNKNNDGHILDWKAWPESMHALACACAEKARVKGWEYFGLQFYGECWSGPTLKYDRDGSSNACVGVGYKPCTDASAGECVGEAVTNYVYRLKKFTYHEPINGGWSEWAPWSTCSASCDGGKRTRSRTCTNPEPAFEGLPCEGDANQEDNCNTEPCDPENCMKYYEKVGCFHDTFKTDSDRVFPNELLNHRDKYNTNNDGHILDWKAWPESMHKLACGCAAKTQEKGWEYFGLQFYGECWSGPSLKYDRDGPSNECIGVGYKPCNDASGSECVGPVFTNYVYKLKGVPGGPNGALGGPPPMKK